MEILLGLVVLIAAGFYINQRVLKKTTENTEPESAEAVKGPVKCGCGRSPTGNCVGLHALSQDDWAVHDDNPNKVLERPVEEVKVAPVETKAKPARKPRAPAKPKSKPVAKKAPPAKKAPAPRKPRIKVAK
jgi:hypothetical protein